MGLGGHKPPHVCATLIKGLCGTVKRGYTAGDIERSAVTDAAQQMLERRGHDEEYWQWEEKRRTREVPD